MASIMSKINDESSSVGVPIRLIGSECYIKKYAYEEATNKALDEIEKYKKASNDMEQRRDKQISEMMVHIDCLKAELLKVQCHYDKLKQGLAMKDGIKMFGTLMEDPSGETRELPSRYLYENLYCAELNQKAKGLILPVEPIDIATMPIKATETVKTNPIQRTLNPNMPDEYETEKYSKNDLRQTTGHSLTYCKNVENED